MQASAAPPNPCHRQALLVIDMQNDFLLPDAPLCVANGMKCLPYVQQAVAAARRLGILVVWVIREHEPSGIDVERYREHLYRDGRPGATVKGTTGAAIIEGLHPLSTEPILIKKRFSAFFQTYLDLLLRRAAIENVVICGVQTPNCIRATACDAVALDYELVTVLNDATASASAEVQDTNMRDLRNVGVEVLNVDDWEDKCLSLA
jgi:nicotinamidase-related amidase